VKWSLAWKRGSDGGWLLEFERLGRPPPAPPWAPLVEVCRVALLRLVDLHLSDASAVGASVATPPRDSASVN
jgi:hypothetical protein